MVMRLDLENCCPTLADVHRAGVFTRALEDGGALGGQPPQQRLRTLVRAVLGPQDAEHAQLDLVRSTHQLLDDDPVLLGGQRYFPQLALVNDVQAQETRTFIAFSATERNSFSPSVPPSSASEQRSGCGIMPSTLPRALTMPAMLCIDPLGLEVLVTRPVSSQ